MKKKDPKIHLVKKLDQFSKTEEKNPPKRRLLDTFSIYPTSKVFLKKKKRL